MSENGISPAPPDDDRTPTQDDVVAPEKPWVMPEPVFRRSSGYTPSAAAGPRPEDEEVDTLAGDRFADDRSGEAADTPPNTAAGPAIAEQPHIAENDPQVGAAQTPEAKPAPKKGGTLRVLLIIAGVILAVLAVAAAAILFMLGYIFQVSESQNLN